MTNKKSLFPLIAGLAIILSMIACNFPYRPWVNIEITSHEEGQAVILNEEVRVISFAASSKGIESVSLFINEELVDTQMPPEGTPREFIADQPWIPTEAGIVTLSVVATEVNGIESDPAIITLQVVTSLSDLDQTPTPTATPEGLALTQTAQAGCTNGANFVQDVTIPANAFLAPGSNFTKIWRVNNTGTCDWVGYQLVHASGDPLGAVSPQAIPMVSTQANADISVEMVAPTTPGTYSSTWQIRAGDGSTFGPNLSVTIIIPQPTDTPIPTPTATSTRTPTPTNTVQPLSVEQVQVQISIPANSSDNATATCPAGSVVVSGGFAAQSGVRIWHSVKDGNGWRVFGRNTTGSSRTINVYATCLHNSGGSSSIEYSQINANANDITQLDVSCPSGSVITGGGWVIGSNTQIEIYNSTRLSNGWQIYVNNTAGDTPLINVYAVCLSGVSGSVSTASNTDGQIPANEVNQVEAACPSGTYVTGGGFATNIGVIVYNTSKFGNGWQNFGRNTTGTQKSLNTYATCYSP